MQAFKVLHLSSVDCDSRRGAIVFNLEIAMAIRRRMSGAFSFVPLSEFVGRPSIRLGLVRVRVRVRARVRVRVRGLG